MFDEIELIKKVEMLSKMGLSYKTSFDKLYAHNTDTAVLCLSQNGRKLRFQQGFYNFFSVGDQIDDESFDYRKLKKLIFKGILNFEEAYQNYGENLIEIEKGNLQHIMMENIYYNKEGTLRCMDCSYFNVTYEGEECLLVVVNDNTEHIEDKLILNEISSDKDVLLKEVHHRVKNNLQVLNSFLNLERRAYRDNPNRILDNMQARLSSLALLHEKTYNTEDFININLDDYMQDQDSTLQTLFGAKNINFTSEVDKDIHLSIQTITPLLLVVDELTMNAIKHAFPNPDMPNKTISKKIDLINENVCELILRDNGVGLKDPEALINHNLGWEIINNLTRQINGKIEIMDCDVGTGFRILFPTSFEHTLDEYMESEEQWKHENRKRIS